MELGATSDGEVKVNLCYPFKGRILLMKKVTQHQLYASYLDI